MVDFITQIFHTVWDISLCCINATFNPHQDTIPVGNLVTSL
jgi:hypothetical protein